MTLQEWTVAYKKELSSAGIAAVGMLILLSICFYLPKPVLKDAPLTTKEAKVSLQGAATPNVGITIFNASGTALLVTNTDASGTFSLVNVPIGEGKNTLTIRAMASGWRSSLPLSIEITKDTTAPSLSINPLQGAEITDSNTALSGKAEAGSSVTVNGVKTDVNADGSWTATIALVNGKNTVTVSATDPAGNTVTQTQTIQYKPSATDGTSGTATTTVTTAPTPTPTPAPKPTPTPTPTPKPSTTPASSIVANAWVSNQTTSQRANQTIYAYVKDNLGRPVTNASVTASVYFKSGIATYVLRSTGNGNYSVSFKLNDKYISGYQVNVDVAAHLNTLNSLAHTSFTPMY